MKRPRSMVDGVTQRRESPRNRRESELAVPLLVPTLPNLEALTPYLARIDRSHWYSNFGPLVDELEDRLRLSFGGPDDDCMEVVTVSNATVGLELALRSLDLPSSAAVLVPAFTFAATAAAVLAAGLRPVCGEIDPRTWQLTAESAEDAARNADIRAVVPVCVFGREQVPDPWRQFHDKTGIPVVIDAAAAFGNQSDPGPTCAVFSMHATKPLSSGEGGFVVTRSRALAASVRQRSNFGINLSDPLVAPIGYVTMHGVNGKLSEYHAAVGLASLDEWNSNARVRRQLHSRYAAALSEATGNQLEWQAADVDTVRSVCACLAPSAALRVHAERACAEAGVATRRWYCPTLDRHPAFAQVTHLRSPVAASVSERLIGVPFYTGLDSDAQQRVAAALSSALRAS